VLPNSDWLTQKVGKELPTVLSNLKWQEFSEILKKFADDPLGNH
jgi:phosphoglycerate-specific signal transduction histidine kinase